MNVGAELGVIGPDQHPGRSPGRDDRLDPNRIPVVRLEAAEQRPTSIDVCAVAELTADGDVFGSLGLIAEVDGVEWVYVDGVSDEGAWVDGDFVLPVPSSALWLSVGEIR